MIKFMNENEKLKKKISELKNNNEDHKKISEALKKAIGGQYKDEILKDYFKLRNSLKAKYGNIRLENAIITVPINSKEIHAESNLLEARGKNFEIHDVVGTKVPCVACFTRFCQENQQEHLLQYTSSVWFSKPCMTQLNCEYTKQSAGEVLNYLQKIDEEMKDVINDISRYTGKNGDIKCDYDDDDSDSMGDESRFQLIEEYF